MKCFTIMVPGTDNVFLSRSAFAVYLWAMAGFYLKLKKIFPFHVSCYLYRPAVPVDSRAAQHSTHYPKI
jgi:hypothetical protein